MFYASSMCLSEDRYFFFFAQFTTPVISVKKQISESATWNMDSVLWHFTIMSVDFEGGKGKTVRACLHLVILCVLSDRKYIWFVTFGHIKKIRFKSDLELSLPHSCQRNQQICSAFYSSSANYKIEDLDFLFHSLQFARRLAGFIRGDLTITCHTAYNTLSHVCFLTFWEK